MARTEWLSEGGEKLAFTPPDERDNYHCDVAIVGSGYGGAVAAARLAGREEEGGRLSRVWVLERGHEFVPGAFPERFADLIGQARLTWGEPPRVSGRPEGLFDLRLGDDVSALVGNGLGGGSLINAGVLARPLREVFREPWPRDMTLDALEPHFRSAERMLGGGKLPHSPAKLRALEKLATRIDGRQADRRADLAVTFADGATPAGVQQLACVGCGDCFTGCNHGAKNTLPTNYLALARRRGARLFTGITVLSVGGNDRDGWEIDFRFTDRQIAKRFGEAPPKLRAKRVILAAGAYGSTGILLRSQRRGLKRVSASQLGKRFSTNGDMIAAAYAMPETIHASAREETAPSQRNVGPTIAGMIDLRKRRVALAIEELAIPAALRRPFEEIVTSLGVLHGLARGDYSYHRASERGADPAAIDPELISRTAVYATMGDDGAAGRLDLLERAVDADKEHLRLDDDVRVDWKGVAGHEVFREAIRLLEDSHAATGAYVMPNPMWRALPGAIADVLDDGQIGGSVLTVHPLGGCAMAEHGAQGVVNRLGQVFKGSDTAEVHATLVVLDGAIVPTALEINPCLTIAALAEYAAAGLRKDWKLGEAQATEPPLPQPPVPVRTPWPASERTGIRLAERLTGDLKIPVKDSRMHGFEAELEIEYRDIRNLESFVAARKKSMPVARAQLKLRSKAKEGRRDAVDWRGVVELDGELRPFDRAPSTPWGRILRAIFAWLCNRGARELLGALRGFPEMAWRGLRRSLFREPRPAAGPGLLRRARDWLAVASAAGEARLLSYRFVVRRDVTLGRDGARVLAAGDELHGRKTIAYVPALAGMGFLWPSPWDQVTRLPLALRRRDGWRASGIGALEVDLPYFVKQYAAQLQVTGQENQPRAIADLFSFFAYVARLVGKIHIWSFRAPDYPNPYPEYEFNQLERRKAEEAAAKADVRSKSRLRRRLPGRVAGLKRTFSKRFPVAPAPGQIRLTRYEKAGRQRTPRRPVLLIHGLGASGNTFTLPTVDECLVKHLAERGFDPWVLDLRTSVSLPCSKTDWSFDDVAFNDIPAAIAIVRDRTRDTRVDGDDRVDVVAHCIGAAMFSMAALKGKLKEGGRDVVHRAVLSQAGPLMELPPTNRFRGYLASYLKHYLDIEEFDTTATLTRFNRFVDRILAAYPYPPHEWREHLSLRPLTHEAYCLRTFGIYGRLFEHANLNRRTLDQLGDMIGHVRYQTYQQTIFYATMRRLTDKYGKNVYVTPERIEANLAFPLCFLHGVENAVFDVRTSRRSFDLMASIFWWPDLKAVWQDDLARRYDYGAYGKGRRLRIVEIEHYGHQDCMIGDKAHRDVYPKIVDFLRAEDRDEAPENSGKTFVLRPPRLGPVLGWLRPGSGACIARASIVPNDSRSAPLYALTFLVRGGAPVPGSGRFRPLHLPPRKGPPVRMLDVPLPDFGGGSLVVLTVHYERYESELLRDLGEPPRDDPFGEDFDHPLDAAGLPADVAAAVGFDGKAIDRLLGGELLQRAFAACKDFGIDGEPLGSAPRVSDPRYATPVSAAVLDRRVLSAADGADRGAVCFALASCRYAANAADRELADRTFGRLHDLLQLPDRTRPVPQFLFLAGDTIYADATYGVFDPTLAEERFDQRYFEAWTAPNAREVLRRLPVYPMLDDHEVEENFEGQPEEDPAKAGIRAFEAFHMMLTPLGSAAAPGYYSYDLQAGGFRFFVADTRTGRRRERGKASRRASIDDGMLADLKRWLRDAHRDGPAKPKFIVSPSVVVPWSRETRGDPSYALRSDAWDGFPYSLHELLRTVAEEGIRNVVFLSGDYHCSVFCTMNLGWKGRSVRAFSIVSSGLYSPYPFANTRLEELELAFSGTLRERLQASDVPRYRRLGELEIDYAAKPMAGCASFAVVSVERRADGSWLTASFDEGESAQERLS